MAVVFESFLNVEMLMVIFTVIASHEGFPEVTPYNGIYVEALSKRSTSLRLQLYKRVEIS